MAQVGEGTEFQMDEQFAALHEELNGQNKSTEFQLPEKIGELGIQDFEKLLEEASGGSVKNFAGFKEALDSKSKYAELQEKLTQAQQQIKLTEGGPKFANGLVEKLDTFYKSGVPEEQIYEFLRIQKMDIEKMDDKDVLKMKYAQDYPGMTEDDFEKLLEAEFGDLEGLGGLKMKAAAKKGRESLAEMKISLSEPEHLRMQKAAQEKTQAQFQNWHRLLESTHGRKEKTSFKVPVGDEVHEVNFNVPAEFRGILAQEMAKYATMNNIPPTPEGMKVLEDFSQRSIMFKYGTEIMATLFRNTQATTKETVLSKVHNVEITKDGNGGNQAPIPTKKTPQQLQMERIAKEGMSGKW